MRFICLALFALSTLAAACSLTPRTCRKGTILLRVTLDGTAASADTLDVSISVNGGGSVSTFIAHSAGVVDGTVEIEFPSGYPRDKSAIIALQVTSKGVALGSGLTTIVLSDECETAQLTISSGDGFGAVDLIGRDLTGVDLTSVDLSTAPLDLTVTGLPDLTGFKPDLAVCKPVTENCFNGKDDDCDGLVDCADPDCTPTADCEPTEAGATNGASITTGTCPASTTSLMALSAYKSSSNDCAGCAGTCTAKKGCSLTFADDYSGPGCNTSTLNPMTIKDSTCYKVATFENFTWGPLVGIGTCTASGTANPSLPAITTTTETFCSAGANIGAGCGTTAVCVPKAATCVLLTGSVTCPSAYPKAFVGGTSYTEGRTCASCECGVTTQSSCTTNTTPPANTMIDTFQSTDCSGEADGTTAGQTFCNGTPYQSIMLSLTAAVTAPTCSAPAAAVQGNLAPANPHTICCQ